MIILQNMTQYKHKEVFTEHTGDKFRLRLATSPGESGESRLHAGVSKLWIRSAFQPHRNLPSSDVRTYTSTPIRSRMMPISTLRLFKPDLSPELSQFNCCGERKLYIYNIITSLDFVYNP